MGYIALAIVALCTLGILINAMQTEGESNVVVCFLFGVVGVGALVAIVRDIKRLYNNKSNNNKK